MVPVVGGSSPLAHPIITQQPEKKLKFAPVAQLDRVAAFEAVGRRFESCRAYQIYFIMDC